MRTIELALLIACASLAVSGCKRGAATRGPYDNVVDVYLADNAGFQSLMQGLPDFSTVYMHAPESGEPFSRQNDPGSVSEDAYILLQGKQHIEILGVSNSFGQKPVFRATDWLLRQIFSLVDCQHVTIRNIAFETLHSDSLWFTDVSYVDLINISHDGVVRDSAIRFNHQAQNIIQAEFDLMNNITIRNGSFDMTPGSLSMNTINLDIGKGPGVIENADANEIPAGSSVWIRDNAFRHYGHSAIAVSRWADVVITENVFLDQSGQPLRTKEPTRS